MILRIALIATVLLIGCSTTEQGQPSYDPLARYAPSYSGPPTLKELDSGGPKSDGLKTPGVSKLVLHGTKGPVTQEEIDGVVAYLLERPLMTNNLKNHLFATWTRAHMFEWAYGLTGDLRLANRLIDQARSVQAYRDDRIGRIPLTLQDGTTLQPVCWAHYHGNDWEEVNAPDTFVRTTCGIASIGSGPNFAASAARLIAQHPALWEKTYEQRTYLQIAEEMLGYVHESWDFVLTHYHDPKTELLLSPAFAAEPVGEVPQWNRVFPLMAAGNTLVDTYAALGKKNTPKAQQIDRVLKAMFAAFWEYSRIEEVNGSPTLLYPYGIVRLKQNPNHTEDFGHFGFDLRGFRVFAVSGRYWSEEQTMLLVNTMRERLVLDGPPGTFADRLIGGTRKAHSNYSYMSAFAPMIWLTAFDPELDKPLAEYVYGMGQDKGFHDGRVVWHLLNARLVREGLAQSEDQ